MYTWQLPMVTTMTPQPVGTGTLREEIPFSKGEGVTEAVAVPPSEGVQVPLSSIHCQGEGSIQHTSVCHVYLFRDCELLQDLLAPSSFPSQVLRRVHSEWAQMSHGEDMSPCLFFLASEPGPECVLFGYSESTGISRRELERLKEVVGSLRLKSDSE